MRAIDGDRLKRKAQKVATEAWKMKINASVETILNEFMDWIDDSPTIEPQSHWIPCSERMPELNVYVIATTQWYEITMACRIGDGEWFINEGDSNAYDDDVIAWMPLPEPYQEGADE